MQASGDGVLFWGNIRSRTGGLRERSRSSNWKELAATGLALRHFLPHIRGQSVCIQTDNQVAKSYLVHQGGMCHHLYLLSREIGLWSEQNLLSLTAVYLPGTENGPADQLSRRFPSSVSLCLSPQTFQEVIHRFGSPWLDLFATQENSLLPHFCSLIPSPLAWATDALSVRWPRGLLYCFPPIALIPRVVRKIREDQALVLLVVPHWPWRSWFPLLLQMATVPPWQFPLHPSPLRFPILSPESLKRLNLGVWMLNSSSS